MRYVRDPNHSSADHFIVGSLEAGAALYAAEHTARGTLIGQEGGLPAQATRSVGTFVIAAILWHFVVVPYLVVTGVICAIPTLVLAVIADNDHSATLWRTGAGAIPGELGDLDPVSPLQGAVSPVYTPN